jgi:hypothetical protein
VISRYLSVANSIMAHFVGIGIFGRSSRSDGHMNVKGYRGNCVSVNPFKCAISAWIRLSCVVVVDIENLWVRLYSISSVDMAEVF